MEETNQNKINEKDFYGIRFYEYGKPFYGSYKGMRFKLARNPLKNVFFASQEEKEDGVLEATIWPEPFSFEITPDEKKTTAQFPFSEEGRKQAVAWFQKQYDDRKDEWRNSMEADVKQ